MGDPADLAGLIDRYKAEGWVKEAGAHSIDLTRDEVAFEYDSRREFRAASTIKLAIACEVLRQAEAGAFKMGQPLRRGDLVGGSGLLRLMKDEVKPTPSSMLNLMLDVSDNSATNWLIDLVGKPNVNRLMGRYSLDIHLSGRLMRPKKRPNTATPEAMSRLMGLVHRRKMVSPWVSSRLVQVLRFQQHLDMIPGGLPGERVRCVNKTGGLDDLRADVGVVWGRGYAYTVAMFVEGFEDGYRGGSLVREASHALWESLGAKR
ncbi:MAG: serine hydrolase [Nitrososphaerota archaeon]|nr:serine hydrolase [Nitrososphaerota archaeon]